MYSLSEPRDFVDVLDLDIESEWNTQYDSLTASPLSEPTSPTEELLYGCAFCLSDHAPSQPCELDSEYSLQLPSAADYSYQAPVYREEKPHSASMIQSNYRKWLVSVTPR